MTVIQKTSDDYRVSPNFRDYERTRAEFRWSDVSDLCEGMGGGCNIGYAAVDRHAYGPAADRTALRFISDASTTDELVVHEMSYGELATLVRQFTNVLRSLGVGKGERVFTIMGRVPELYVAVFGALRNGCVVSPLFSAFGPEPLATRINIGEASVLVTTAAIYDRKIAKIRDQLTSVRHIILLDQGVSRGDVTGTLNFRHLMAGVDDDSPIEHTAASDPALLHFTSGTTGTPKGAIHVHGAVRMHYLTGLYALDLHRDDIYLVHRGSRLGHRDVLRSDRTPAARRHLDRRRGGVRRKAVVPDPAGRGCDGVVYRAHRDTDADQGRPGTCCTIPFSAAAIHRQCR